MPSSPSLAVPSHEEVLECCQAVFGKTPCQFQRQLCVWQLQKQDIISISPTGSGKTLTFWLPLLFSNSSIIIVITALNLLGDQFVKELQSINMPAISVTASNNTEDTFKNIQSGNYRVVILNPEIATRRGGYCETKLWSHAPFSSRILNVIFDEGHCIVQWGDTFRSEYANVGMIRHFLRSVPFYVTSATLPYATLNNVMNKLNMSAGTKVMRRSNDRWNVAYSVHRMEHPIKSLKDLAFLIPDKPAADGHTHIPSKFMVFFNSKKEAENAAEYLRRRLPLAHREKLRWLHTGMSRAFRTDEVDQIREGGRWGVTLTDIGGMGVDIPDIMLVVQWRAPNDLCTLMQRFGRAARSMQFQGLAILIAEPRYFYTNENDLPKKRQPRKRKSNATHLTESGTTAKAPRLASTTNMTDTLSIAGGAHSRQGGADGILEARQDEDDASGGDEEEGEAE
ncbi:P-loop containing nucleoside triphosphate hydrolase protein [Gloeopeniophorella convolvens]|nr:P-loop containing nucleoside triphosphate hydrolase protein [Gloeopeniophorella convolvens]